MTTMADGDARPALRTDVNAFVGAYPFRHVPHPDPETLLRVMDREGIDRAWVGSLPAVWHRDPSAANTELLKLLQPYGQRLRAAPAIRPDWPDWCDQLHAMAGQGVAAIRAYPPQWGLGPDDAALKELAGACAECDLPLILTVKFEDLRQRHPLDGAGDLQPAAVRQLARARTGVRLIVTAASRDFIDEVYGGLTPDECRQVYWDISWIWGPPEDHLAHLLRHIGASQLLYGTMWPLRLTQVPRANLALLPDDLRGTPLADVSSWGD
ncbi:MAG: hypothetical protein U0132_22770 [Gemmatimonadaceae bacterium]